MNHDPLPYRRASQIADLILDRWEAKYGGVGIPPYPIPQIAIENGWQIKYRNGLHPVYGWAFIAQPCKRMVINADLPAHWQRIAVGHEMGHDLLDQVTPEDPDHVVPFCLSNGWHTPGPERDATMLGGRLLMPDRALATVHRTHSMAAIAVMAAMPLVVVSMRVQEYLSEHQRFWHRSGVKLLFLVLLLGGFYTATNPDRVARAAESSWASVKTGVTVVTHVVEQTTKAIEQRILPPAAQAAEATIPMRVAARVAAEQAAAARVAVPFALPAVAEPPRPEVLVPVLPAAVAPPLKEDPAPVTPVAAQSQPAPAPAAPAPAPAAPATPAPVVAPEPQPAPAEPVPTTTNEPAPVSTTEPAPAPVEVAPTEPVVTEPAPSAPAPTPAPTEPAPTEPVATESVSTEQAPATEPAATPAAPVFMTEPVEPTTTESDSYSHGRATVEAS